MSLLEWFAVYLEVDGCEASLWEAETALGVVPRGFFHAAKCWHRPRPFPMAGRSRVAKPEEPRNPFNALVILLGVAFLITAFGYGTMAYRATAIAAREANSHELMSFLDRWGLPLMAGELVLLGIATGGVMWLDQRRAAKSPPTDDVPPSPDASRRDEKIS